MPSPSLLTGLRISRCAGLLTSMGLAIWAVRAADRLTSFAPTFASIFLTITLVYAALMALPWSRIPSPGWKVLFVALCLGMFSLSVVLIGEVAYIQTAALSLGIRARPPMLQGGLLFLCLLQVPTIFFLKNPEAFK